MSRQFLPWWRTGAAALVTRADGPALPARAELSVRSRVDAIHDPEVTARLYGPGEVTGLDPRQVIRTDPVPRTTDFEPNFFPLVEFDTPELPWAFTPATANAADQLRPWLVLVVVPRSAARGPEHDGRPLPVLGLDDARSHLPDLAQSWAWAHLQVTGPEAPQAILNGPDPARTLSRLLCPRRLEGDTAYVAAVVPAFAQGVAAGLGQPVDGGELRPAWGPTTTALELPVLYSWEFATGPVGDFEELAARLRRHPLTADDLAGLAVELVDQPGGLSDTDTIRIPGALGSGGDVPPDVEPAVRESLAALLELPEPAAVAADLPLPLPAYGRWHAGRWAAPSPTGTGWFDQLALHPAARAVAALGTRAVQERQEQLMASAWAQVGEIARLNRLLRQGQLAREAARVLHRRLAPQPDSSVLAAETLVLAGPALTRLIGPDRLRTIAEHVIASRVPGALFTAAARRVLRPRGPVGRWTGVRPADLVLRADDRDGGDVPVVGTPLPVPPGTVTVDVLGAGEDLPRLCDTGPGWWLERPEHRPTMEAVAQLSAWFAPCERPDPPPPLLPTEQAWAAHVGLDPERTVTTKVRSRVELPDDWAPTDPLEPVLVAPEFPTPMYWWVRDNAPELLLPGIGDLPVNSLSLVGTNPWFSAAFLAGLNHEMGRELLWRGYPTDQRGTSFRRFWDRAVAVPPAQGTDLDDIRPLTDWPLGEPLDEAGRPDGRGRPDSELVLLIRGELPRRYPRATIYAAEAVWRTTEGGPRTPTLPAAPVEEHPVFGGTLDPDVTFRGFAISPEQARGDDAHPGYYIVFQEQPTEARFGLDVTPPVDPTGTWGDLSWAAVTVSPSGHVALGAADPITVPAAGNPRGLHFSTATTAAHVAGVVEQRPYRVAVHAAELLPREGP